MEERKPDDQPPEESEWKDVQTWPPLGTVVKALRRMVRLSATRPPGAWGSQGPPAARPLARPRQTGAPPALRPGNKVAAEYLRIRVQRFNPGTRVVRVTIEMEGEVPREEDVSEDAGLVESIHVVYVESERPTNYRSIQ
jgi:hypothetical protein